MNIWIEKHEMSKKIVENAKRRISDDLPIINSSVREILRRKKEYKNLTRDMIYGEIRSCAKLIKRKVIEDLRYPVVLLFEKVGDRIKYEDKEYFLIQTIEKSLVSSKIVFFVLEDIYNAGSLKYFYALYNSTALVEISEERFNKLLFSKTETDFDLLYAEEGKK